MGAEVRVAVEEYMARRRMRRRCPMWVLKDEKGLLVSSWTATLFWPIVTSVSSMSTSKGVTRAIEERAPGSLEIFHRGVERHYVKGERGQGAGKKKGQFGEKELS